MSKKLFITCLAILTTFFCRATLWHIGSGQSYTLPSQVKNLVQDGDTVFIDGGIYLNDAVKWTKSNLRFIGLGIGNDRTVLRCSGDIPNGKGIFVFESPGLCDDIYIENIVFEGAQISDANGANGAGIRFQARNLTVKSCLFIHCQNGILEGHGSVTDSNVIIEQCEFSQNGYQLPNDPDYSGYEHHLYIGASTDTLVITNCYLHDPRGQANSIKSRAQRSFILYNMIDEAEGYGSWEINIAQGGLNVLIGNIIIQGTSGANHGIVGWDTAINALEDFYFINNTVINQFSGNIAYFNVVPASGINTFKVWNNLFVSVPGANTQLITGNIPSNMDNQYNALLANYPWSGFTNPNNNDFTLNSSATEIIDQGGNAGTTNTGFSLSPSNMYQSYEEPLLSRPYDGNIDIGAFEFIVPEKVNTLSGVSDVQIWPNPSSGIVHVKSSCRSVQLSVLDIQGRWIERAIYFADEQMLDLSSLPEGIYLLRINDLNGLIHVKKLSILR
ncbi:MAG: T9SS type A sorting domain-containing protein [Crocinitomicaceae bacterium]|nr:T9SS type A sorting domain-containing protein [Crocinitomicaceae bacterium]